jgi:hypothetical protein
MHEFGMEYVKNIKGIFSRLFNQKIWVEMYLYIQKDFYTETLCFYTEKHEIYSMEQE